MVDVELLTKRNFRELIQESSRGQELTGWWGREGLLSPLGHLQAQPPPSADKPGHQRQMGPTEVRLGPHAGARRWAISRAAEPSAPTGGYTAVGASLPTYISPQAPHFPPFHSDTFS